MFNLDAVIYELGMAYFYLICGLIIGGWYLENARRTIWWFINDDVALWSCDFTDTQFRMKHGFFRKQLLPNDTEYGMIAVTVLAGVTGIVVAVVGLIWPLVVIVIAIALALLLLYGAMIGTRAMVRANKKQRKEVLASVTKDDVHNKVRRELIQEMVEKEINERARFMADN